MYLVFLLSLFVIDNPAINGNSAGKSSSALWTVFFQLLEHRRCTACSAQADVSTWLQVQTDNNVTYSKYEGKEKDSDTNFNYLQSSHILLGVPCKQHTFLLVNDLSLNVLMVCVHLLVLGLLFQTCLCM